MLKDTQTAPPDVLARATIAPPPSAALFEADDLVKELYRTHALTLTRAAKLLLRDTESAEDVVQDAFLGLYQALPRLSDHDKILPYLRTAVLNRARSALRSRRRAELRQFRRHSQPETGPWPAGSGQSAESATIAGEDRRAVLAAVAALPRRSREVLVLRYYLDLPDAAIAATLGVSRGTVSSTASRALAALARNLQEEQ